MPSRLYSTHIIDHYFICIGDEVYNYREEWDEDRKWMLDYRITLSSIVDGIMAERRVNDEVIRKEVLEIVNKLKTS
jgi:hypothetical protein